MKKLLLSLLCLGICFGMAGCSSSDESGNQEIQKEYFSADKVTHKIYKGKEEQIIVQIDNNNDCPVYVEPLLDLYLKDKKIDSLNGDANEDLNIQPKSTRYIYFWVYDVKYDDMKVVYNTCEEEYTSNLCDDKDVEIKDENLSTDVQITMKNKSENHIEVNGEVVYFKNKKPIYVSPIMGSYAIGQELDPGESYKTKCSKPDEKYDNYKVYTYCWY